MNIHTPEPNNTFNVIYTFKYKYNIYLSIYLYSSICLYIIFLYLSTCVCVCVCPSWFLVEEESGTHVGRGEGWRSAGRGQCSGRAASYRHASCDLQTLKGPFVPSVLSLPPPSPKPRLECPEKTIFGELNAEGWGRRRERERTESLLLDIAVQFPHPEELLSNFFFRHV